MSDSGTTQPRKPQRAILTGASGGIGQAIAEELSRQGVALLLVGRRSQPLSVQAEALIAAGGSAQWLVADIATADGRGRLVEAAREWQPELLIHNAGISRFGWLTTQSEVEIEEQIRVNLLAPMLLNRALLPLLLASSRPQIVHVGSVFGSLGFAAHAPYCASKFGLRGMVEALRRELADQPITISYLGPRATATDMNSARVVAMNQQLGNQMDAPATVAAALWKMVERRQVERILGQPEGFFAWLNQCWPRLIDSALRGKLAVIRRFAEPAVEVASPQPTQGAAHGHR